MNKLMSVVWMAAGVLRGKRKRMELRAVEGAFELMPVWRGWRPRRVWAGKVVMSTGRPRLDEGFRLRLGGEERAARVRLVCFEHVLMHGGRFVQVVVRQRYEVVLEMEGDGAEVMLESLEYPASGQWGQSMYPFYRWELWVEGDGGRAAVYPLEVQGVLPAMSDGN